MIRRFAKGALPAGLALVLAAAPASAQLEDNLSSLTGNQTEGYLGPLAKGLSATMNSGIFRSGAVPFIGFHFTVDIEASYISFADADRVYQTPALPGFASTEAPTVIGDTKAKTVDHETLGDAVQFTYPGGFDMQHFGIAVPQLTIGSVLGTRAIVRYISLSLGDEDLGDFQLFGIGGQHSVSRYLPGMPIDLAVGAMWQRFTIGDDVVDATAVALNVTGSRRFGAIVSVEPYVGVGLDSFEMTAEYDTGSGETISVEFDRRTDLRLTLGAGLNLPVLKVHGELNLAAENGFAGGISFGI